MKHYLEVLSDKILPKFNDKCAKGKCKHKLCECGHCPRNYHIGKLGQCTKINMDLTTCNCKKYEEVDITKTKETMEDGTKTN